MTYSMSMVEKVFDKQEILENKENELIKIWDKYGEWAPWSLGTWYYITCLFSGGKFHDVAWVKGEKHAKNMVYKSSRIIWPNLSPVKRRLKQ